MYFRSGLDIDEIDLDLDETNGQCLQTNKEGNNFLIFYSNIALVNEC